MNNDYCIRSVRKKQIENEYMTKFPFNIPSIRKFETLDLSNPVVFFVGENGSGKSTLLEGIAVCYGFNPEGGTVNFNFSTKDTHSSLSEYLILTKGITNRKKNGYFLRAESFYNLATEIDNLESDDKGYIEYYGGTSLHKRSHGEAFLSIILNRLKNPGLYIFDEPESALSFNGQIIFLDKIKELTEKGAQFIISTHSPILTAYRESIIYEFDDIGITRQKYEDTNNYTNYKYFLRNPDSFL